MKKINNDTAFEIVKSIRAGNIQDFRLLVDEYQGVSLSLAMSILKNQHEAEDALQESFFKAFNSLGRFKMDASFSTWLYRIVVNTCLTHKRKQKTQSHFSEQSVENIKTDHQTGFEILADKDRKKIIQFIIQQLKPDEALVLNLFYLSELSIDEIVEITNFKPSKIKVTLHRARKSFKSRYESMLEKETSTSKMATR